MANLFPLTVAGLAPRRRLILKTGKTLSGVASTTVDAHEFTPAVRRQVQGLLNGGYVSVLGANGLSITTAAMMNTLLGDEPNRTQIPGSFAPQFVGGLHTTVLSGFNVKQATTTATNANVAAWRVNLQAGTAYVRGIFVNCPSDAADYAAGTNGFLKNGTSTATVLSGGTKEKKCDMILAVATDGTYLGPSTGVPVMIQGDEAATGAGVALTDAQLTVAAQGLATTAGKTLLGWLKVASFTAVSSDGSVLALLNAAITNHRTNLI